MGLSKYIKKGVGIDIEPDMIKLANQNKQKAGVKNIKFRVSNIPDYFKSNKNLLDFLNKAPTIPGFGKANDYEILEKFIKNNRVEKGIKSNTSRFFLEMSKE